jgi:hypothetical protein
VFDICTDDPGKSPAGESAGAKGGQPIPNLPASRDLSLRVILSAHRRLMQMSESNRTQFREVVEMMERELGSPAADADDAARH